MSVFATVKDYNSLIFIPFIFPLIKLCFLAMIESQNWQSIGLNSKGVLQLFIISADIQVVRSVSYLNYITCWWIWS